MNRKIVGKTGVNVGADIGTEKETLVEENALIPFLTIGSGAFCMKMMEMQVTDIPGIGPAA